MSELLLALLYITLIIHIILVAVAVWRVWRGENVIDCLIAVDLSSTLFLAVTVIIALIAGDSIYIDVALVLAALGFISTVACPNIFRLKKCSKHHRGTMSLILEITAIIVILIGTAFSIIGMIGFIRLPDVYTRLHATGKVGVYGVVMLLVAAVLQTPLAWGKALILIILLLVSGPVAAHAIASAATRIGLPMHDPVVDELHLQEINPESNSESSKLAYNKDMD